MGSVHAYETKAGKRLYRAVWRDPLNQQTSKRGFPSKKAAEEHIARQTVSKADGTYISSAAAKTTVSELSTAWLANKQALLKPSSYAPLRASWANYVEPAWGPRSIAGIRHSEVQAWVAGIGKSPTVVARAFGILAGILDTAERDRRILANPARGVRLPRKVSSRSRRYLTHEELWAVAEASPRPALVLTLGYCGLRWGELVALRVSDVNFLRHRISVTRNVVEVHGEFHPGTPKTHESRQVPVPATVLQQLAAAVEGKAPQALIFDDGHGGYMRRTRASAGSRSWWVSALVTAGVEPLVLHDLRHTAASLAVSSGANVKAIQRMLGHASAAMTLDVYADLFDDDLEALTVRLDEAIAARVVAVPLSRAT
ncbi:Putative prophage phiRv2 integrase [Microbacterium lemovicicum]|uniref:Prophage phiRv2 integrase n=1 Tax=Microbacterium lemovicicum TaxID=1072463 RepID=A0A3S9WDS1_9MICO|nr:site-specific integrase [Microbacterium lemovicicum]AZS38192.1 Putative prophage phiRv2 integrase [Microbacterium lemovicicum]